MRFDNGADLCRKFHWRLTGSTKTHWEFDIFPRFCEGTITITTKIVTKQFSFWAGAVCFSTQICVALTLLPKVLATAIPSRVAVKPQLNPAVWCYDRQCCHCCCYGHCGAHNTNARLARHNATRHSSEPTSQPASQRLGPVTMRRSRRQQRGNESPLARVQAQCCSTQHSTAITISAWECANGSIDEIVCVCEGTTVGSAK